MADDEAADTTDGEWRFSLEDIEAREEETEDDQGLTGVFGSLDSELEESLEPGSPNLENVAFVLLGVLVSLFVIWQLLP